MKRLRTPVTLLLLSGSLVLAACADEPEQAPAAPLTLATWNLEWLIEPE